MAMREFKAYLFDFDGTLFNTEKSLIYVYEEAFGAVGISIDRSKVMDMSRKPLSDVYREHHGDPLKIPKFKEVIWDANNSMKSAELIEPYDEIMMVLNYLNNKFLPCAIVTNNNIGHIYDVLKLQNMPQDLFQAYVGITEITKCKPDPQSIQLALKKLDYRGKLQDVCYIGDGKNDVLAAKNAGVTPILIDRLNEYNEEDEEIDCEIIHNLKELMVR